MRPKLQSMPPPPRATPETCWPSCFRARAPGHELEAEPVIDHGEAAGGERQALAIGAGDILAVGGRLRAAGLGRELVAKRPQFAPAAMCRASSRANTTRWPCRSASPARQDDRRAVHRVAHLGAEPAAASGAGSRAISLAVEPGRAGAVTCARSRGRSATASASAAVTLRVVEVRAARQSSPAGAVAGRLEIGELDVMGAPVDAVDHGIGRAVQFVVEARDRPAGRSPESAGSPPART